MSNGLFFLYLFFGTLFAVFYVLVPLMISFNYRITAEPDIEFIDPTNYPIPEALSERLEHDRQQLTAAGFQPLSAFILHGFGSNVESLKYLFINHEASCVACVGAVLVLTPQNRSLRQLDTRITCDYQNSQYDSLVAYVSNETGPFFSTSRDLSFLFPQVTDVARLLELFSLLELQYFPERVKNCPLYSEFSGNVTAWARDQVKNGLLRMYHQGFLTRVPNEDVYRLPLRSVYRIGWYTWWPMRIIHRQLLLRRGKKLERELLGRSSTRDNHDFSDSTP